MAVPELFAEIRKQGKLFEAASNGKINDLLQLLNEGVNVNVSEHKMLYKLRQPRVDLRYGKVFGTPLIAAAENDHVDCVKVLIERGADVNARDVYSPGLTALHKASERGHLLCVKELLEAGAIPDMAVKIGDHSHSDFYFNGTTALHLASLFNHVECVAVLIEYGADYNAVDSRGRTSLYIAAEWKNVEAVLALFENSFGLSRPLISLPSFDTGETPLHFCMRNCPQMEQCVIKLIEHGADVNHVAFDGNTPLWELLFYKDGLQRTFPHVLRILDELVTKANNIDFNIPNKKGFTPLHYVGFYDSEERMKCRSELAALMLSYGANPYIKDRNGCTLFEYHLGLKAPRPVNDFVILKALAKCMVHLPYFAKPTENPFMGGVGDNELDRWLEAAHQQQNHLKIMNYEWYLSVVSSPRSLRHYSRFAIRSALGPSRMQCIRDLHLPEVMRDYLMLIGDEFV